MYYKQTFKILGSTGRFKLCKSKTHINKYEKGNIDVFELELRDIGEIEALEIDHDNAGYGSLVRNNLLILKRLLPSPVFFSLSISALSADLQPIVVVKSNVASSKKIGSSDFRKLENAINSCAHTPPLEGKSLHHL